MIMARLIWAYRQASLEDSLTYFPEVLLSVSNSRSSRLMQAFERLQASPIE